MAENSGPFPFPSTLHGASSVTIKLSDSNYLLWKTQFESLLRCQKLLGFVTGSVPKPPVSIVTTVNNLAVETPNPEYEAWICTDELIKSWIFGTLTEEVLGLVHALSTSQDVWLSLASNFNKSSVAREFDLRRRLQLLNIKGKTFTVYCREFRAVCDNLSSIGKPVDESMKIFTFLNGLGREYDPITTVLQSSMSRFPPPTFNDVVLEVSGFDSKLQSYETSFDVSPHLAFQTQRGGYFGSGQRGRGNNRGRGGYSTRGRGFSQQVTQNQSGNSSTSRLVCQICGRVGHVALKCWNRFDNSYQSDDIPQALAALHVSDASGREWVTDSGSTAHITATTDSLQTATPYNGPENVMVADGSFQPITHVGSTTLTTTTGNIPLNDVLVCPTMEKSLLSVSKLCEDYPCGVFFDANFVYVIDLQTQKVVTKGPRREGLYVLKNMEFAAFYSNRQVAASDIVWHQRLGHANFQILQLLQTSKAIIINKSSTTSVCEPCQMGKSTKLPFYSSVSNVKEPLDRLHCDLWGPSPVVSVQGFKYYAVIVDDFTRYSWLFPLKSKSDFCDVFVGFQKRVENQFGKKIKIFQSDGGGEFINTRFRNHLQSHGIQHLLSCPSTPEQNGIAERKHRHVTELGLSMLFQSKTPLKFWVEAFYSANLISNLLPSPSLNQKSPHELLLKSQPNYTFLRVFGSACYPFLRSFTQHKFEPRSLQCVFLGYNPQYKGYRCLYPPIGRVYISRHVIFDETCFPFTERYKDLAPRHKTGILGAWQAADESLQPRVFPALPRHITNPHEDSQWIEYVVEYPQDDTGCEAASSHNEQSPSPSHSTDQSIVTNEEIGSLDTVPVDNAAPAEAPSLHPMRTRSKDGIRKPNPRYALVASKTIPSLPKTVAEALNHPGWRQAMLDELNSIYESQTLSLIPATAEMNVLGCRWVFTVKLTYSLIFKTGVASGYAR